MLTVPNTIGINIGNCLQGSADGPLGIGALLVIALIVAFTLHRRHPTG